MWQLDACNNKFPIKNSMSSNILFSIITPAYLGADYLPLLFECLSRVYLKTPTFEWIIVDDSSPDGGRTIGAIENIRANADFLVIPIHLRKNHLGARSAYEGSIVASGKYTIILDQDDQLTDDALEVFSECIKRYESRENFAGVCARCETTAGRLVGSHHRSPELFENEIRIRHLSKIRGELFQCTKTSLIREYFADLRPGNTNGLVWARIADLYKFVYIKNVVRIYNTVNPHSWTNQAKIRFVSVLASQSVEYLDRAIIYFIFDPMQFIRLAVHAGRYCRHAKNKCRLEISPKNYGARLLINLVSPISIALCLRDERLGKVSC